MPCLWCSLPILPAIQNVTEGYHNICYVFIERERAQNARQSGCLGVLLALALVVLLLSLVVGIARSAGQEGRAEPMFELWRKPQDRRLDSDQTAHSLGEKKANFDDLHILGPHVIQLDGEF
jgi:hypothetical protein